MEILEKAELQRCFHYEKEIPPMVEIRVLEQSKEEELTFRKNEIVFMTEGKVRLIFRDYPEKILSKGEFIFFPVGGVLCFVVLENTQVTVIRPSGRLSLCEGYHIEELYLQSANDLEILGGVFALEINRPLQLFLEGLNESICGGLNCRYYFDTKVKEMFVLLKAYYRREQLRSFFSLILSPDMTFSEYIKANYHKYATCKELAGAMNMAPKLFSKKFIRIFGESPTEWIRKVKAQHVYMELYAGNQPIALIADKYNFSSQSHLNKFCKKEFGKNPGEIRRRE